MVFLQPRKDKWVLRKGSRVLKVGALEDCYQRALKISDNPKIYYPDLCRKCANLYKLSVPETYCIEATVLITCLSCGPIRVDKNGEKARWQYSQIPKLLAKLPQPQTQT